MVKVETLLLTAIHVLWFNRVSCPNEYFQAGSPLCANSMFSKRGNKEALVGVKGVVCEDRSEVSQTTNVCTDEQEDPGWTVIKLDWHIWGIYKRVSKHNFAKPRYAIILIDVDVTVIERKNFTLPGEVSAITGWYNGEVSRSHSRYRKRALNRY